MLNPWMYLKMCNFQCPGVLSWKMFAKIGSKPSTIPWTMFKKGEWIGLNTSQAELNNGDTLYDAMTSTYSIHLHPQTEACWILNCLRLYRCRYQCQSLMLDSTSVLDLSQPLQDRYREPKCMWEEDLNRPNFWNEPFNQSSMIANPLIN